MKEEKEKQPDRHLDAPSEANRDRHINFLKVEEESANTIADVHNTSTDRQKQWREGVEEGRTARNAPGESNPGAQPVKEAEPRKDEPGEGQ